MSDTKSVSTLLQDVKISSQNERVFICDLCDLTLNIIFDIWWASINVDSKRPIACNNSGHVPSWRLNLNCGIE
jgi:hypothetical protein